VHAGVLSRLEVAKESSGGLTPLNISKEDEGQSHPAEVEFQWKNFVSFHRSRQGGNGRSKFSMESS
jgi:hypothetical protein